WAFGPAVEAIARQHIRNRARLIPYLYALFATGAPPLRPMAWHWPDDPTLRAVDDQFLLGPDLLVAPVLTEGATRRTVQTPPGRWFDALSGAAYDGPGPIEVDAPLAALPMFAREGALIVRGPARPHVDAPGPDVMEIEIWPGDDGAVFNLPDAAGGHPGASATILRTAPDANGLWLRAERAGGRAPVRSVVVTLRRVDQAPRGVFLNDEAYEGRYQPDARTLTLTFDDPGAFTVRVEYTRALAEPIPSVDLTFVVEPPLGTEGIVHVATSADGWQAHHPLEWDAAHRQASGRLTVPGDHWVSYKYTRGAWCTVEKGPDCAELPDRVRPPVAGEPSPDVITNWRDACDPCP
ncbi:MAG: hypothetical protein KC620_15820, partial [Myxococcales bacterium]|nr:hypothetical protein [Myxococcales bacterium]